MASTASTARWAELVRRAPAAVAVPVGAVAAAVVAAVAGSNHPANVGLAEPWIVLLLLAVTVAGELVAVRVRRDPSRGTDELTLFEAAAVADALLLSPRLAIAVPVVAIAIASWLLRRPPGQILFGVGTAAASCSALVGCVAALGHDGREFHGGSVVVGLLLGTMAFVAINLFATAAVRSVLTGVPVEATLRQESRLAAVMAISTLSLGATATAVAEHAPLLLPFSLLPAAALTYAYAAVAEEGEERIRSQQLLALSHLMAGALDVEDLVTSFLALVREAFRADSALVVLESAGREETVVMADVDGVTVRYAHPSERALLATASGGTELIPTAPTVYGPARVLLAPLDAEGRRLGIVALTEPLRPRQRFTLAALTRTADRSYHLGTAEATVLGPLASALAVALRGAEHLARLTEETDKLQQVVDGSSDGIVVLDGAGTVVVWSPAMAAMTGVTAAGAVGLPLGAVVRSVGSKGEALDPLELAWRELSPLVPRATVETAVVRPDGEQRWVRWSHAAVFEAPPDMPLAMDEGGRLLRDVVLVHDLTRDREVDRLKTDFLATVSHELRSPITPIKGYVDLLKAKGEEFSPDKRAGILDLMGDRVAHLTRLVEDVLLASRVATPAASVMMGLGDLAELTRKSLGDFAVEGERLRPAVSAVPLPVACDPVRVVQVVSNLVSNALKYSPESTLVHVRAGAGDGEAYVEVVDAGRGIPADQLERIFEKFHRVEDAMKASTGGTGLGLYIARQLAEGMGGRLTVTSTYGSGSTFRFVLPLLENAELPPPGAPRPRVAGRPPFPSLQPRQ